MFHASIFRRLLPAVLLAMCLLAAGCTKDKVTKANFDKINDGMSLAEVEAILGKGEKEDNISKGDIAVKAGVNVGAIGLDSHENKKAPGDTYNWTKGDKKITVIFQNDKVMRKIPQGLE
jgi:hypothetical protein